MTVSGCHESYVILTGSKNNAGDYLIKYRAKELLRLMRPDRKIIDYDGWLKFDQEKLDQINKSAALILLGGPALQQNMYPNIYPLVDDLNEIKTPICMMGLGWKSLKGDWASSQNYRLSKQTANLIKRIRKDDLFNSVRDYHTFNILRRNGLEKVYMTGCPATYDYKSFDTRINKTPNIKKIGFSLGVSFLVSKEMTHQMKKIILELKEQFNTSKLEVVFHHSLKEDFLETHNSTKKHLKGHLAFSRWLEDKDIDYIDISGSAENLINYYESCDLHVGYRVHAHIFMNSISKPSILITEDGRGKALRNVFGGAVIDGFYHAREGKISRILRKFKINSGLLVDTRINEEVINLLNYELENDFPEISTARYKINKNFKLMEKFISHLP